MESGGIAAISPSAHGDAIAAGRHADVVALYVGLGQRELDDHLKIVLVGETVVILHAVTRMQCAAPLGVEMEFDEPVLRQARQSTRLSLSTS